MKIYKKIILSFLFLIFIFSFENINAQTRTDIKIGDLLLDSFLIKTITLKVKSENYVMKYVIE
jgi:hypothetical protein